MDDLSTRGSAASWIEAEIARVQREIKRLDLREDRADGEADDPRRRRRELVDKYKDEILASLRGSLRTYEDTHVRQSPVEPAEPTPAPTAVTTSSPATAGAPPTFSREFKIVAKRTSGESVEFHLKESQTWDVVTQLTCANLGLDSTTSNVTLLLAAREGGDSIFAEDDGARVMKKHGLQISSISSSSTSLTVQNSSGTPPPSIGAERGTVVAHEEVVIPHWLTLDSLRPHAVMSKEGGLKSTVLTPTLTVVAREMSTSASRSGRFRGTKRRLGEPTSSSLLDNKKKRVPVNWTMDVVASTTSPLPDDSQTHLTIHPLSSSATTKKQPWKMRGSSPASSRAVRKNYSACVDAGVYAWCFVLLVCGALVYSQNAEISQTLINSMLIPMVEAPFVSSRNGRNVTIVLGVNGSSQLDFEKWLVGPLSDFFSTVSPGSAFPSSPSFSPPWTTSTGGNLVMGAVRLRQFRVGGRECTAYHTRPPVTCYPAYSLTTLNVSDFAPSAALGSLSSAFVWHSSFPNGTGEVVGRLTTYDSGGFAFDLGANASAFRPVVESLLSLGWMDDATRAVFVETTVSNPNFNGLEVGAGLGYQASARYMMERSQSGASYFQAQVSAYAVGNSSGFWAIEGVTFALFAFVFLRLILFVYFVVIGAREQLEESGEAGDFSITTRIMRALDQWVLLHHELLLSSSTTDEVEDDDDGGGDGRSEELSGSWARRRRGKGKKPSPFSSTPRRRVVGLYLFDFCLCVGYFTTFGLSQSLAGVQESAWRGSSSAAGAFYSIDSIAFQSINVLRLRSSIILFSALRLACVPPLEMGMLLSSARAGCRAVLWNVWLLAVWIPFGVAVVVLGAQLLPMDFSTTNPFLNSLAWTFSIVTGDVSVARLESAVFFHYSDPVMGGFLLAYVFFVVALAWVAYFPSALALTLVSAESY